MKKILLSLTLLMLSVAMYAQNEVTKFLGIPIDGTKAAMIQKLKAKGFTYNAQVGALEGTFNGEKVFISIQTNKNKVWRINVFDKTYRDETQIKIRFNNLCQQFDDNPKYYPLKGTQNLSDNDDISYGMTIEHKQFEAIYYQLPYEGALDRVVWFTIGAVSGEYNLCIHYENKRNEAHGEDL
ncbi:hypothetical protein [Prevotella sp.]